MVRFARPPAARFLTGKDQDHPTAQGLGTLALGHTVSRCPPPRRGFRSELLAFTENSQDQQERICPQLTGLLFSPVCLYSNCCPLRWLVPGDTGGTGGTAGADGHSPSQA